MANLSNINNFFVVEQTTGYVGIGTTDPAFPLEVKSASAELALNATGGSIYRVISTASDEFIINKNGVGDRLTISSGGDATFAGDIKIAEASNKGQLFFGTANTDYEIKGGGNYGYLSSNAPILRFDTGGTERMRIDSAGRLSLGPDALDIQIDPASTNSGNNLIYMRGNASDDKSSLQMNHYGHADYYIGVGHVADGKFNIANDLTGNDFVIDTSGRVGIGTTSPGKNVEIKGAASVYTTLRITSGSTGHGSDIEFGDATDPDYGSILQFATSAGEGGRMRFIAGATETMNLRGGNVGIGTSTPGAKLSVQNTSTAVTSLLLGNNSGSTGDYQQIVFQFSQTDTSYRSAIRSRVQTGGVHGGNLSFWTDQNGTTTLTERMTIDTSGNVGIGEIAPAAKLDVKVASNEHLLVSDSLSSVAIKATNDAAAAYVPMSINAVDLAINADSGGDVGIGTASPDALLELEKSAVGAVGPTLLLNNSAGGGGDKGNIIFASYGTTYQRAKIEFKVSSETDSPGNIDFYTGRSDLGTLTQKMTILGSGNVGIGTTSPAKRLDVNYSNSGQEGASLILRNLSGGSGAYNRIYFAPTASDYATRSCIIQGENVDGNNNMALVFKTGAGATPSERMRIDQNGDISMTEGLSIQKMLTIGTNQTSGRSLLTIRNYDASLVNTGDLLCELLFTGRYYSGSSSQLTTAGINLIKENADGNGYGGALAFDTGGGAEAMRIDSSGNSLFGTTSSSAGSGTGVKILTATNGERVSVVSANFASGAEGLTMYSTSAGAWRFYVSWDGVIHATNTSISAISDVTLKENIKPLETGLDEVMKLQPRRFDWKNGDGENIAGFIAQEVEEVLPDLVSDGKYTNEETKKSLAMGNMIPTLVNAIQELKAEIEILKSK